MVYKNFEITYKEDVGAKFEALYRYLSERTEEKHEYLNLKSQCPDRTPPEYNSETLPLKQTCWVSCVHVLPVSTCTIRWHETALGFLGLES
jgi:hypothetical protein